MIIQSVTARNISIPLHRPVKNSAFSFSSSQYTLVSVTTDDGFTGWGFAFGEPLAKQMAERLAPMLIGEALDIRRLWHKMADSRPVRFDRGGIAMRALSAIDIALWDILGKRAGLPIHQILGGYRQSAPVYYSGGHYPVSDRLEDMLDYLEKDIQAAKDRGFSAYKMKIGGTTSENDLKRIAFCREKLGADKKLMLDAFCAYRPHEIIPMAERFAQYDITWLEEPVTLDDTPGCALVAKRVSMPIAIGEAHFTMAQFRDMIDLDAAQVLMPDICYVGGFTGFAQLAAVAGFKGLQLSPHWCHDLSVHLALAYPQVGMLEYMDGESALFLLQKVLINPVLAKDGFVFAPDGPGHGLILDEDAVNRFLDS